MLVALDNNCPAPTIGALEDAGHKVVYYARHEPDDVWFDQAWRKGAEVYVSNDLDIGNLVDRYNDKNVHFIQLPQNKRGGSLVRFIVSAVNQIASPEATEPTASTVVDMTLPTDSAARKNYPLLRGCLRYFPAALAGVSKVSKVGNDKHNPGEELHHARGKSMDHGDCIVRHLLDVEDLLAALNRGDKTKTPQDVLNEVNQMAWRALAFSQEFHERFGSPLAPGAKAAK